MTNIELDKIEALASAATPGPWACSENVHELFGMPPIDWWLVYARDKDMQSIRTLCRMSEYLISDEEEDAARKAWRNGGTKDPGQSGNNARFIAAANPATIQEMVADLKKARADACEWINIARWLARELGKDSIPETEWIILARQALGYKNEWGEDGEATCTK